MLPEYEKTFLSEYLNYNTDGKLILFDKNSEKLNDLTL